MCSDGGLLIRAVLVCRHLPPCFGFIVLSPKDAVAPEMVVAFCSHRNRVTREGNPPLLSGSKRFI